ncbi:MAG: tetratricopeptide repeat protein [Phycisphaerales bacterium]
MGDYEREHETSGGGVRMDSDPSDSGVFYAQPVEAQPRRIGRYEIIEQIGEGGFGLVYRARQVEGVRREVAVKVLKPGMDSRAVLLRFEAERQALARMKHAGIAHIIDAGETDRGLPYFVMEYVDGDPIIAYCDRARLNVRRRLELFVRVCDAVQHAHDKGVLHRDIKPGNVLVTDEGGAASPKVIDFGVAKAMTQPLTDDAMPTRRDQQIGTPEYMSPEQVRRVGGDVDVRSDVYALGVLLYELLIGDLPYDRRRLRRASMAEFESIILDEEAPRPSRRLTGMGDAGERIARERGVTPDGLARALGRDLDWIPIKALRKDRQDRYRSVAELADDVRRYLAGRPLQAGPDTWRYRCRGFWRRYRGAVLLTAFVFTVLLAATALSASFAVVAQKERRSAQAAEQVVGDLFDTLLSSTSGQDVRQRLDQIGSMIDSKLVGFPKHEAASRLRLGRLYVDQGMLESAEQQLSRAEQLGDASDLASEIHLRFGYLRQAQGRLEEAEARFQRALDALGASGSPEDRAAALQGLGLVQRLDGRLDEAETSLKASLDAYRRAGPEADGWSAWSLRQLAEIHHEREAWDEEEAVLREAEGVLLDAYGPDDARLATVLRSRGQLATARGDTEQAIELLERALTLDERMGGRTTYVAATQARLAIAVRDAGDFDRAEALLQESLRTYRMRYGSEHQYVARTLRLIGDVRLSAGDVDGALAALGEMIRIYRVALPSDHWEIANGDVDFGRALAADGRYTDAEPMLLKAEQALTQTEMTRATRRAQRALAEMYEAWGRPEDAARWRAAAAE